MIHRSAGAMICSFLMFLSFTVLSQTDSLKLKVDSTFLPNVVTTAHFSGQSLDKYGTYGARVGDPNLSHAYAGVSVFNTLRGQVPSLSISSSIVHSAAATFRGSTLLCVDGMPYDGNVSYYYNLNAFEFESIAVVANPNTDFSYGSAGLNGGIFLRSKTGENKARPSFEFNSYTSRNLSDNDPVYREPVHSSWNLSNSFAYSQDYGAVDLRVSYNLNSNPFPLDSDVDGHNRAHSFKLNGGLDLGKFTVRFIGDYRTKNWKGENNFPSPRTDDGYAHFLQGNLIAQYEFNEWLKITSQHISSATNDDSSYEYSIGSVHVQSDQPRRLHNVVLSLNKRISKQFSLRSFAGVQLDRFEWTRKVSGDGVNSGQHAESENTGLFVGVGGEFGRVFFVDLNYRNDSYHDFPGDDPANTIGASGSFVFSRLFTKTDNDFFGKFRSYIGRTSSDHRINFPQMAQLLTLMETPSSARKNLEIGADLAMVRNRITLATSYYRNVQEDLWTYMESPFVGPRLFNLGEFHYSGYEFVAGFNSLASANAWLSSRIIFFKNNSEIKSEFEQDDGDGDPFLGHRPAKWQASWFNQFSYRAFYVNVLLDARNGGDLYLFDNTGTSLGRVNGSFTKFRDITFGYNFGKPVIDRMNLASARISISGRNLIQFNDKDDDAERYSSYDHLKSVSFSLSVEF